jgi:hypothetical protein
MGDTLGKGVDMDQMYEALIAFKKRGSEGPINRASGWGK